MRFLVSVIVCYFGFIRYGNSYSLFLWDTVDILGLLIIPIMTMFFYYTINHFLKSLITR